VFPYETPTRLRALPGLGPFPLRSLPWIGLGLVVAVAVVWQDGPAAAALAATLGWDRWGFLGLRLALGVLASAPCFALAAPGVVLGYSLPGLARAALAWAVAPRLTLWRAVPPCAPAAVGSRNGGDQSRAADTWGGDREAW
jgi:hypothetical protein